MTARQNSPIRFAILFIVLFLGFYYFNIGFFSITSHGRHYVPFFAEHLNYIKALRDLLIWCSAAILKCFGFVVLTNDYSLLVAGKGMITLVYSCLGLGVMSFFSAFVIAYPKPPKAKIIFLVAGLLIIQLLNIARFTFLTVFWDKQNQQIVDHHTIFNALIYILITISLYFWVKADTKTTDVKD
ncbi:MAG TPA: archaeosortase/exosortase family protein [Mucilaginibacter sp.]|jgi:exosortase/archaeosortase family protein|nr:archaeosortase/exosortase family protein [Mucilaginibacter sp.]